MKNFHCKILWSKNHFFKRAFLETFSSIFYLKVIFSKKKRLPWKFFNEKLFCPQNHFLKTSKPVFLEEFSSEFFFAKSLTSKKKFVWKIFIEFFFVKVLLQNEFSFKYFQRKKKLWQNYLFKNILGAKWFPQSVYPEKFSSKNLFVWENFSFFYRILDISKCTNP